MYTVPHIMACRFIKHMKQTKFGFKCLLKHTFLQVGTVVVDAAVSDFVDTGLTSIPLKPLPAKQQITFSLPLGEVSY